MVRFTTIAIFLVLLAVDITAQEYRIKEYRLSSGDQNICYQITHKDTTSHPDKVIVWAVNPAQNKYIQLHTNTITSRLKEELLDSGYINVEYIGRNETVLYEGRKYESIDRYTAAEDLSRILEICRNTYPESKIVIIGSSEGGAVAAITGAAFPNYIYAMVQLSCPALTGKENTEYYRGFRQIMNIYYRTSPRINMDYNIATSLDSEVKWSMGHAERFIKENIVPMDSIIFVNDGLEKIYKELNSYQLHRWNLEDEKTRLYYDNDYNNYYNSWANSFTPRQIALMKFSPREYYSKINCPILAVYAEGDRIIDAIKNEKEMHNIMNENGNDHYHSIMLNQKYGHNLSEISLGDMQYKPHPTIINDIIQWIAKQQIITYIICNFILLIGWKIR